ncbi:MAG: aminoacyl-tRNA hydrolase [Candidatus Shapirobacteria bacterium]|jgi:PTH1 family peptidyl-tRNA hydrolase
MKLFVGLGNPGEKYRLTRHNLGQMVVNQFVATHHNAFLSNKKLSAKIAEYQNSKFATLNSFMNESGFPVSKIVNYFKISPQDLYIIHDDLDLPIGEYRFQCDRGPAGHKGVSSIIEQLGTQAFHRIRIGIGKPTTPIAVEDYVLQPFSKEEQVLINQTIDKIITETKTITDFNS